MKTLINWVAGILLLLTLTLNFSAPIKSSIEKQINSTAIVMSYNNSGSPTGGGSGFFINSRGDMLTCAHVVDDTDTYRIINKNGTVVHVKQVLKKDKERDIALITVDEPSFKFDHLNIEKDTNVKVKETVVVIGNPWLDYDFSMSEGIVSALRKYKDKYLYLQVTAPAYPGNSGGPILNERGNVIGMVSRGRMFCYNIVLGPSNKEIIEFLRGTRCEVRLTPFESYINTLGESKNDTE